MSAFATLAHPHDPVAAMALDTHRALTCARRRALWMRRARRYKAAGLPPQLILDCVTYARESNRDVMLWAREARREVERAL